MTDLENKEAFKAWFKKEYLGIDDLANQGDEGAITRRDYAYVGYQAAKAESHKQAALYQFEINHLAQANQQWREKAAKASAVPKWISVKDKLPSDGIGRVLAWVVEQNSLGKCGFVWNCSHSDGVFSDKFETFQVTHWMPLPDAPQESDND